METVKVSADYMHIAHLTNPGPRTLLNTSPRPSRVPAPRLLRRPTRMSPRVMKPLLARAPKQQRTLFLTRRTRFPTTLRLMLTRVSLIFNLIPCPCTDYLSQRKLRTKGFIYPNSKLLSRSVSTFEPLHTLVAGL